MDVKVPGKGTVLKVTISSVLTTVPGIISITPPSPKQTGRIDHTDIADDATRKTPTKVVDWQDVKVKMMWDPANAVHAHILAIAIAGTTEAMKHCWADTGTFEAAFNGWVEDFPFSELKNDVVQEIDFTIVPDGAVTIS